MLIFDSHGGLLEFENNNNVPTTYTYLEPVSVGLIESSSLFFFEEYWSINSNASTYLKPLPELGHTRSLRFSWLESNLSDKIYLYTIDDNKTTITVVESLIVDLTKDGVYWDNYTNNLPTTYNFDPTFLQINIAITSDIEESINRTLQVYETIDGVERLAYSIIFYGETEGEDDNYKIMVNNFRGQLNISDKDSITAFREIDIEEENIDYSIYNKKRKELLVSGTEIIPYMGSYKGMINALNYFGYYDMRIREYWLNIDNTSSNYGKYAYIDVKAMSDGNINTNIPLLPTDRFRKTSLFGLFWDLNSVVPNEFDQFGIPLVKNVNLFSPEEVIIKIDALIRKLKKDFLPLSAKVVDVVGEGVYFELFHSKIWLADIQTITINREIIIDFHIETPLGSLQRNNSNNLQDFIYDLRSDNAIWNTFSDFNETLSFDQYTIVNHNNSMWVSTIDITPGVFNPSDWIELAGINSLRDITANNPTFSGIPISAFTNQLVAYFSNIRGDQLDYQWPDAEDIDVGCPIILHADLSSITWDDGDSSWDDVYGDLKEAQEYNPTITYQIGDYSRYQGINYIATAITTGAFDSADWLEVQSETYSWNNLDTTDLYEMTWIVTNVEKDFTFKVTGLVNAILDVNDNIIKDSLQTYPLVLPYTGDYTVELQVRNTFNDFVYKRKPTVITINSKVSDFICFSYFLDEILDWNDGDENWDDNGSVWELPSREHNNWDAADLEWDSTNFAKYKNNQPKNKLAYFGYDAYYWDNFPYNDWDELASTTWGMLEEISDANGGFEVIINNDDFTAFNASTNTATIGKSSATVDVTISNYQDLADWYSSIDNEEFKTFTYAPFPSNAPDRMKAFARFSGEYGFYKDWTKQGYYDLNDKGAVSLSGEGWSLIWNCNFTWEDLDEEWDNESPIYHSLPNVINEPGDFIIPPISIYREAFSIFTLVPIFIVPDNSRIPGKTNYHWEIWDHEKGYKLFEIDHPYIIWTFTNEGIYSVSVSCQDSNGNYKKDEKRGWIKVKTKSNVNPFTRAQRMENSITNPPTGIEYSFVIEDTSTPLYVS